MICLGKSLARFVYDFSSTLNITILGRMDCVLVIFGDIFQGFFFFFQ